MSFSFLRGFLVSGGLVLALLSALPARADIVVLKNGSRYEGRITQQTPDDITIHSDGSDWTFARAKIESFTHNAASTRRAVADEARHQRVLSNSQAVVMYSTSWDPVCRMARRYMTEKHIFFIEKDIERDPRDRHEMMEKCRLKGFAFQGVPILDVKGRLMDGFDSQKFARLMKRKD